MATIEREQQPAASRAPGARPAPTRRPAVLTRAELVSCTCPEACERDHEQD